jgi:hypothetical protein
MRVTLSFGTEALSDATFAAQKATIGCSLLVLISIFSCGCNTRTLDEQIASEQNSIPAATTLQETERTPQARRADHRLGTSQLNDPTRFLKAPSLIEIPLPDEPGFHAIWGATGRDDAGRIYLGVAAYGVDNPSANLLRYTPSNEKVDLLGSVNAKLDELKVRRFEDYAETQMKIHSKPSQANDGFVYFSTQDEHDEVSSGKRNPKFGGRLMRIDPTTKIWESVFEAPEALIALGTAGRYVYVQGYFGGVLYQFDTQTSETRSVEIGSYMGHVPRNIVVDAREHVFMVQAREATSADSSRFVSIAQGKRLCADLVEIDSSLSIVGRWPLSDYEVSENTDSHGLTGFCTMQNGDLFLVAATGACWLVSPGQQSGKSRVERLGWFHPLGTAYCASVFCPSGSRYVMGLARRPRAAYEWIVYDLEQLQNYILELDAASQDCLNIPGLGLWGTQTLDDQQAAYLVGWKKSPRGMSPCVLRATWPSGKHEL